MFGLFIKGKRFEKSKTLKAVAQEIGISQSYLIDIEKSRRNAPGVELLEKLVTALDLGGSEIDKLYAEALNESSNMPADIIAKIKEYPELISFIRAYKSNVNSLTS